MQGNEYTLPNGLRIIHEPTLSKVAYCGFAIDAGTRDEAENEQGMAHFVEHLIFKGTEKRKAWHILNRMENVGGDLNAYTNKEETVVYAAFLKEHLEKYSLQNAVKYEYFYDKWVPMADVLDLIPLKVPEVEDYVNKNRHIELKDTAFYYFLNVSDFRSVGEQEPYEFARPKVKDMMLNLKQVEFMKKVKDDLYQQAVKKNEIKYN